MAVAFKTVLPVTIDPTATSGTIKIDLSGLVQGDVIFGAWMVVGFFSLESWSTALDASMDDINIANFGGYGVGHTFYASYNGTDTQYTFDMSGAGFEIYNPSGLSIACAACAYRGSTGPDPFDAEHLFNSVRYPTSSAIIDSVTPGNLGDLIVTAQVLPNDQSTLGTVSSPFVLRASSVGGLWTHNSGDGLVRTAPSMYAQVQLADYGSGTTSPTSATWTNTDTAYTIATVDGGVPIEGVGVALWTLDVGTSSGLHIWQRI